MFKTEQIKGPLTTIILDEIALDGLEGLTIESLWLRLSIVLKSSLSDVLQNQVWDFIKTPSRHLEFFELPTARKQLKIFNRFDYVDADCGLPILPEENPGTSYKITPIEKQNVRGSCSDFENRKLININEIEKLSLSEFVNRYGEKAVVVASQEYRENVLFPKTVPRPRELTIFQYCILELIARSRYNGEITLGRHSLLTHCRDSSDLFYVRNKLLALKLITKQPYTEKLRGRIVQGCFVTLPRYYTEYKPKALLIMEKMFNMLKEQRNYSMPYDILKAKLTLDHNLKKLSTTIFFRKYFEILRLPYRDIFPEASIKQWKRKNGPNEKQILAVRLRDSNMKLENIFEEDNNDVLVENEKLEFLSEKHFFIDMPLIEQTYRAVEKHGSVGISQPQLIKYLAMNRFSMRGLINKMCRLGIITQYWQEFGRQKTRMYVTIKNTKNKEFVKISNNNDIDIEMMKNDVKLDAHSSFKTKLPSDPLQSSSDQFNSLEMVSVKEYDFDSKKFKESSNPTLRQCKRKKIIIKTIKEKLLIDRQLLRKIVSETELKDGYKDLICIKSLYRLLYWLQQSQMVKCYEFTLKFNDCVKVYQYIAHPALDPSDKIVKDELIRLQNQFQISTEMKVRNIELTRIKNEKRQLRVQTNTTVSRTQYYHRRTPKFLISRFFHEFLCYLIFELDRDKVPIKEKGNITKILNEIYPRYDIDNLINDLLPYYDDNINWKIFIPPLPKCNDKPDGWAYLYDIIMRIPLSLIMKLFQIDKDIDPVLNEYVNHPIRQHYILHQLPESLREFIFKIRINKTCFNILKLLSWTGLIQFSKREKKDPTNIWIYLNKNAMLMDTSISEPGYKYTSSEKEYDKTYYNLKDNPLDVTNYWNYLYKTCMITKLGLRIALEKKSCKELEDQPTVDTHEAIKNDIGYIPGDGRGAAGLHAELYAHLKVNWSWIVKMQKKKLITGLGKNVKLKLSELLKLKSKNILQTNKKRKVILTPNKKIHVKRVIKPKSKGTKSKMHGDYDEIDCLALTKMSSLRVNWNKPEDDLLKISRAVFIYLNKYLAQLHRVITGHIYRDILHKCLNSVNKTSKACIRRLLYLKKHKPTPDVATWVQEMRQNQFIDMRFGERHLELLRKRNANDDDFSNALKVHFIQLVNYMKKYVKNSKLVVRNHDFLIPDTIKEFKTSFKECPPPLLEIDGIKHFHPNDTEEIEISTINSLLHSTLCCTKDKTLYNLQLFEIYKTYKNETLSKAFNKAKNDSLVVQLKGRASTSSKIGPIHGPSYVLSVKYRFALCLYISYDVLDLLCTSFDAVIEQCFKKNQKFVYKILNSGEFFLFLELLSKNLIDVEADIPDKILTLDPKQHTNIDYSDKILDHFHNILECAPKKNYTKILGCGDVNMYDDKGILKQIKPGVKFNIANENYKMSYNSYDIIYKLPDEYFHFFCILNELNNEVNLNFINSENNCIANKSCILNNSNFIVEIQRILEEKQDVILNLFHSKQNEETEKEKEEEDILIINQNNINSIFNKYLKLIKESKDYPNYKKDLGKILLQPKEIDIIEIAYNIINYKDDIQKIEYEPALSKEEKINQEAFVVNLSNLNINFQLETNKKFRYKKITAIPSELIKSVLIREDILKKISGYSIWSNFGSWSNLESDKNFKTFSCNDKQMTKDVWNFIKKFPLGVKSSKLLEKFNNEEILLKITNILRIHYLILRTGVEFFVYVHSDHINPWIVQTYNIKRLDIEALRGSNVIVQDTEKRKLSECDNESEIPPKKVIVENQDGKRISKPVMKFKESENPMVKTYVPKEKELVIYRPCPWIRVNGSINRRVLDKWLGSIVINCIYNSGQSVNKLCETFNQMHPVNIMLLLEILQDLDCVQIKILKQLNIRNNLFSTYEDEIIESDATHLSDFNDAYIVTKPNALTNISLFVGDKKYKSDFV